MNKWMKEVRDQSGVYLHAQLVAKVMQRQSDRRRLLDTVKTEFPEETNEKLLETMRRGRNLKVSDGGPNIFLVTIQGGLGPGEWRSSGVGRLGGALLQDRHYAESI